jgi:hypothetical protein
VILTLRASNISLSIINLIEWKQLGATLTYDYRMRAFASPLPVNAADVDTDLSRASVAPTFSITFERACCLTVGCKDSVHTI